MDHAKNVGEKRACAVALAVVLTTALVGCAPQAASTDGGNGAVGRSNDTAVRGEYQGYDPEVEAGHTGGTAIEGSEEEKLQQERIAGGGVGAVTSQNLEPLEGIVEGSEQDYTPSFGDVGQPPAMGHGDNGSDCLSCHEGEKSGTKVPESHVAANLANEECATCHAAK